MNRTVMNTKDFCEKVLKAREEHPEIPNYIPPEAYPGAIVLTDEEAEEVRTVPGAVRGGAKPVESKQKTRRLSSTRTEAPTAKKVLSTGKEITVKEIGAGSSASGLTLSELVPNADGKQVLIPGAYADQARVGTQPGAQPGAGIGAREVGAAGEEPRMTQTRLMNFNLELYHLPKVDMTNPEQVQQRTDDYFELCALHGIAPMLTTYALALNVSYVDLLSWIRGVGVKGKPLTVVNTLKNAYQILAGQNEQNITYNRGNIAGQIFIAKNHYGYSDKQEIVVTPNTGEQVEKGEVLGDLDLLTE